MGVDGLALGFVEDRDKEHKKRRKGLRVDGVGEIEGVNGEREKRRKKKKDRRKGVEGSVDCVLGSEVGEGCGIEISERDIEESKNFDEKGSGVEVVDDGDRGKKKKKKNKEKEKGKNENNKNALISSTKEKSVALSDRRKRRGDGSDEPGSADDAYSRDDGKKDMDGSGEVKKGKKHASNDAVVDNELRSVLSSAGAPANSSVETKMKVRREEREGKEKKKRNRHARDGYQSKNMYAQGKSEMFAILGESADDAHNDVKHKKKERKKGKQGHDDDCDTKYMVYGNDEFSDIGNENRRKLNADKDNGESASLKADEDNYSYKKKKKKHKSDDSNSALEVANAGIVAVPFKNKVGEMEDQSIDNILCEEERSSVKEKKGKVVSFGEAASSAKLSGDCIKSSSGEVEDGDFGAGEGSKHSRKKKTERKESDKDKSDVQKKSMIKDEDAKRNGMDGIATDGKQREESNGHPKGKSHKRVSFSSEVQVFPPSDDEGKEQKLIIGKRFTKEEDELVKEAVLDYIGVRNLGSAGLDMVLNCRHHSETKGCWQEIGDAIPWRPYSSVYHRAHVLFERSETRKWKPEEYDLIRSYYEEHGSSDWKTLATELGKHRHHLKDTWRRIKLPNINKGHWSQEEYQKLFDLVHMDLRMKAFEEKQTKHGMLRDNIAWEAIGDSMATRTSVHCCKKWYDQLTSSMVVEGIWADADDYLLISALVDVDACSTQEVNWDDLLDHRTGEICRRRWNQMTKHIGEYQGKPFPEQVELLATRYYRVVPHS